MLMTLGTYGELPTPVLDNFYFLGWFTEEDGGTLVTGESKITAARDFTLYAHWIPEHVTISFDPYGGSVPLNSKSITNGEAFGELPVPTKRGYLFLGWYTNQDGSELRQDTDIAAEPADTVFYAHWIQERFTVVFDACSGTVTPTLKIIDNLELYGELPIPERENYVFQGWYTARNGGEKRDSGDTAAENADLRNYSKIRCDFRIRKY